MRSRHRRRAARRRRLPGSDRHGRTRGIGFPMRKRRTDALRKAIDVVNDGSIAGSSGVYTGTRGLSFTHPGHPRRLRQRPHLAAAALSRSRSAAAPRSTSTSSACATTPERFLAAVIAVSPFRWHGAEPNAGHRARGVRRHCSPFSTRSRSRRRAGTFLLDEFLELRTFESFPGCAACCASCSTRWRRAATASC